MALFETLILHGVPPRLARRARGMLGRGIEGAVYDLGDGKVLKVNVTSRGQAISKIVRRTNRYAWAAKTYESGRLAPVGRPAGGFWYVSEKLYPLDVREKQLLNRVGLAVLASAKGYMSPQKREEGIEQALSRMPPALAKIVAQARRAGYHDLHGGNIMKSERGVYKIIDVESFRPIKRGRK